MTHLDIYKYLTIYTGSGFSSGRALLYLLLEHHDALSLLGRQHGDLLVCQLQHLHDQLGLLWVCPGQVWW